MNVGKLKVRGSVPNKSGLKARAGVANISGKLEKRD